MNKSGELLGNLMTISSQVSYEKGSTTNSEECREIFSKCHTRRYSLKQNVSMASTHPTLSATQSLPYKK